MTSTFNTIQCPDDTNVINNNLILNSEITQNEMLVKEYKEKICSLISNNFSKYLTTPTSILILYIYIYIYFILKCIQRLENVKSATG